MDGFVHLHVHSEYSLLDGAARIDDLVRRAGELGMKALALTDHGVMYGAVPFYKACVREGIRPIIGVEAYYTSGSLHDKLPRQEQRIYHLILLAKNEIGYRNLMKLCSVAHLEGFHYKPRIDFEHLSRHAEGLVCLSSCMGGEIAQHVLHDRMEEAERTARKFRDLFGGDYYLELQDHGLVEQKKIAVGVIELSRRTGIPLVVTNDVHYIREDDHAVQDVLICIGTGKSVDDPQRLKMDSSQMFLKSAEEMARLFPHVPEALRNTAEIAEKCRLELSFGGHVLPAFKPIPDGLAAGAYLERLCRDGLLERYDGLEEWKDTACRQEIERRLAYELDVIERMGFSDYFLIVWDFIRYAHDRGITTGPGRGSSAGSLVAYVLRITDVDPIRYKLLFERFLNPERVTMPDIDIDFNDERRDEVIAYVSAKYGTDRVAQIITFGTMAAKAAVRDVGRALNVPLHEVDRVAKLIPYQLGITLEEAMRTAPELQAYCSQNPRAKELIETAMRVEGMPRHASTHAAGVVISREPLTHYVPLQEGTGGTALTQYPMETLESIGLLKMDFLGLRTLSIIERTQRWIKGLEGAPVDFTRVSDVDPKTYELLGRGDTTGIFQLESAGMRRVLRELKPSEFEDIISVLALYRPGPMEFIPKYIQAKHGLTEVDYPHPALIPILKDTHGIIVYQEQIMQIASRMAGFSLGEADLLRRAVSKKKREILDEQRAHFVEGSQKQGYSQEDADRVYDMIVRFADYGFPRAHATAYGVLAFQTAYLKAHHPVPFMAAMLTSVMGNHRKVAEYVDECRRMGIAVLPPDVNESEVAFTPLAGAIRFGLAAIKNVGTQAIESIRKERRERAFDSMLDFCRRVDLRVCNKRVIESLIQAGAFDAMPGHRAALAEALPETVEAAAKWRKEREELQLELFGFEEEANWSVELPDVPPYTTTQQLELERELLGLYLSGHPLDAYERQLEELGVDPIHTLPELPDGSIVVAAGMVVARKTVVTKKGQQMAFIDLEDRIDKAEVVLFPDAWKKCAPYADKGSLLIVRGRLELQEQGVKLLAEEALPLGDPGVRSLAAARRQVGPAVRSGAAGSAVRAGAAGAAGAAARGAGAPATAARPGSPAARPGANAPAAHSSAPALGSRSSAAAPGSRSGVPAVPAPSRSAAAARPAGEAPARARQAAPAAAGAARAAQASRQRLYVKIAPDREQPERLTALKTLLISHPGPMQVVLFYEKGQKTLALQDSYNIKPSPDLIKQIGELLGLGSAKVK